ncbi:hypothetical protein DER45DRAFT_578861 [Fusarium avenaceum]|nr:hypothetical protein DER45DRAFT_578861 [Fusarium avenaceum]
MQPMTLSYLRIFLFLLSRVPSALRTCLLCALRSDRRLRLKERESQSDQLTLFLASNTYHFSPLSRSSKHL